MNPFTSNRSVAVAVGVGLVVGGLLAVVAAGTLGVAATTQHTVGVTDGAVEAQETSENESVVAPNQTVEAMRAAENRTNGTVVGAQLGGQGDSGFGQSKFVYEFDVLADNGTYLVAEVHATNATVIGVEAGNESDSFLDDVFGSEGGVPDEARNASSLRSAADAVELAVNETEAQRANQSVTEVRLGSQNDTLVYTVSLLEPGGEPREIVVAANESEGGIVTTDPQRRAN